MRRALAFLVWSLAVACTPSPPGPVPQPDGGTPDGGSGEPLSTPAGQWTWVPFSETRCGNGTPAGLGLNPAPGESRQVLIFMAGGGACWDPATCYVLKTAVHVEDTYSQAMLDGEVAGFTRIGLMDRQDATNPFRAAHFVYVPYCTGDLHVGDAVRNYDSFNPQRQLHHRGASNMDAFLLRLKATFPDAEQIWLMGSSAGGYGAQLSFDRVAQAFSGARVDLLADSAQVVTPYGGRWGEMVNAWNPRFPPECTECAQRLPPLIDTLATRWPGSRLGLLAYDNDATLTLYFNFPLGGMLDATNSLLASQYTRGNTRYFVLPGTNHVLLGNYPTLIGAGGVSLKSWVRQWATGDPAWGNVR
jgi:hypothetical protein